jgi:dynein heavy chain
MLQDGFKISPSGLYYSPVAGEKQDYIDYIKSLPLNPSPEAFGLHQNAEITTANNETINLLQNILSMQPRASSGSGKTREEIIGEQAAYIQSKTPPVFDFELIAKKFPTSYEESMNTVLFQECVRYNRLLADMKVALVNVQKALKGEIVMSEELEKMANSIFDNLVPKTW